VKKLSHVVHVFSALGIAGFATSGAVASPAGASTAGNPPAALNADSVGLAPHVVVAGPGQTVDLSNYSSVERQLNNPNLTPSQRQQLLTIPVVLENAGPIPNLPTPPPGDPIASDVCDAKNFLGWTVASFYTYEGFSVGTPKGATQQEITQMTTPNASITSTVWFLQSKSWSTSQPGPPTTYMEGRENFVAGLAGVGNLVNVTDVIQFWGNGDWTPSCVGSTS